MKRTILNLLIIIAVALFVVKGYLLNGLPGTDDGVWTPVRLGSMIRELKQGQFPVRWSADLNYSYGYPLFHFSYPGTYYVAALIYPFGLELVGTVKAVFIVGVFSALIGTYILVRHISKSYLLALSACLLVASAPYLSTNLYRRGSIGEILAIGILPWILIFSFISVRKKSWGFSALVAIFTAALVTIHNVSALFSLPLIATMILVSSLEFTKIAKSQTYKLHILISYSYKAFIGLVLGLLFSSFFWVPALNDIQYTKIAERPLTYIHEWFVSPQKTLFYPLYNQGPENLSDYRLSIGVIHSVILFIELILLIRSRKNVSAITSAAIIIIYIIFLMPMTVPLWNILPLLKSVDFPWRILMPLSICVPVFVTLVPLGNNYKRFVFIGSLVACVIAFPWFVERDLVQLPNASYATNQATATSNNEYITKWTPQTPSNQPIQKTTTIRGITESIVLTNESSTQRQLKIIAITPSTIQYALMYFPGWQVYINNTPIQFNYESNGLIQFDVPQGESQVIIKYNKTEIVLISEIISISAGLLIIGMLVLQIKSRNKLQ